MADSTWLWITLADTGSLSQEQTNQLIDDLGCYRGSLPVALGERYGTEGLSDDEVVQLSKDLEEAAAAAVVFSQNGYENGYLDFVSQEIGRAEREGDAIGRVLVTPSDVAEGLCPLNTDPSAAPFVLARLAALPWGQELEALCVAAEVTTDGLSGLCP